MKIGDGIGSLERGNVLIFVWRDSGSGKPRLDFLRAEMQRVTAAHPRGFMVLAVILPTSDPPDRAARVVVQEIFAIPGSALLLMVHLPLGDTIRMSLARTFLRGMFIVTSQTSQHAVASSLSDAFDQIEKRGRIRIDRAGALTDIDELCVALGSPVASKPT